MRDTNATVCTISYDFLCGPDLMKYLQYFTSTIGQRMPKVVDMASTFIQHILDSTDNNINMSGIRLELIIIHIILFINYVNLYYRLSGFCLGSHLAGNVGYFLKRFYKGQMVPVIWGTTFHIFRLQLNKNCMFFYQA